MIHGFRPSTEGSIKFSSMTIHDEERQPAQGKGKDHWPYCS
jgi:hypothetical protein